MNQLPAFQQQPQVRTPSHYLQSTTLTTTSGLGSNYTSYTTDPIDLSLNSLLSDNRKAKFNPAAPGASSSFIESDMNTTDEYLYAPEGEHGRFMTPQRVNPQYDQGFYGGKLITVCSFHETNPSPSTDFYIPNQQHPNMNPFNQPPMAFGNSGPNSFIEFNQYDGEYYVQQQQFVEPPKTPIRTPVMGTRTFQHRRTHSNASSQYSGRGGQVDYGETGNPSELDYRFNNFNISGAIEREPLQQFHSVPYSCNHPDTTNAHPIPNRMRLYENVSHFQHHLHDSPSPNAQHQTPIKTTVIETSSHAQDYMKSTAMTNSMRREMFFNSDSNSPQPNIAQCTTNGSENQTTNTNTFTTTKVSGSTGCTPTHLTPQDSFSDDSSYLSALSSQNRVRFSPDNFLTDNNMFSPTSRIAVANLQRAMELRTIELEEGEKS